MKVQITRPMVVTNAAGQAERFEPTAAGQFRDDIDVATFQRLNRAGAAVIFSAGDQATDVPASTTAVETATAAPNENGINPGTPVAPDLDAMTKEELLAYAKQSGIEVDGSKKKADLLADIKAATASA